MAEKQETADDIIAEMLGARTEFPFVYLMGEPDTPEVIDPKTNEIIEPRKINIRRVTVKELADRLKAALRRERGDRAKLREAVKAVVDVGYPHNFQREAPHIRGYCYDITRAIEKCFAALAAPVRNCDVHTADELKVIFKSELVSELPIANEYEKNLVTIAAMGVIDTLFATAKEGGAK